MFLIVSGLLACVSSVAVSSFSQVCRGFRHVAEKNLEGGTFPENVPKPILEIVCHENLQKGRNEGRQARVKKGTQRRTKLGITSFFWPECLKPLFYSVFDAMRKLTSQKQQILRNDENPSKKKKNIFAYSFQAPKILFL